MLSRMPHGKDEVKVEVLAAPHQQLFVWCCVPKGHLWNAFVAVSSAMGNIQ